MTLCGQNMPVSFVKTNGIEKTGKKGEKTLAFSWDFE